jgi:hypothetical protein
MRQRRIPAVFMRGGTSRAPFFHLADLPGPGPERDAILLAALGSPDPYGRQLDGLGGGISSLSKACIIGPPTMAGADVDYTFAQVEIAKAAVDYRGNCGNCSSAVGPFAIDERLIAAAEPETIVRIHNTNTRKLIVAHVPVRGGEAEVHGDFVLPGVPGTGARIALDFVDPGGAVTGKLLPTGHARDVIAGIEASLVDATNPVVFVRAKDVGCLGTETPAEIDGNHALGRRLEEIRVAAGEAMGVTGSAAVPKVAMVAPPAPFVALDGVRYDATSADVIGRVISMGNCHRAFALTVAMCLAVAARVEGTVVHEATGPGANGGDIRLAHPSGVLPIDAKVASGHAERVTVYRTARRLMEGFVRVP